MGINLTTRNVKMSNNYYVYINYEIVINCIILMNSSIRATVLQLMSTMSGLAIVTCRSRGLVDIEYFLVL